MTFVSFSVGMRYYWGRAAEMDRIYIPFQTYFLVNEWDIRNWKKTPLRLPVLAWPKKLLLEWQIKWIDHIPAHLHRSTRFKALVFVRVLGWRLQRGHARIAKRSVNFFCLIDILILTCSIYCHVHWMTLVSLLLLHGRATNFLNTHRAPLGTLCAKFVIVLCTACP